MRFRLAVRDALRDGVPLAVAVALGLLAAGLPLARATSMGAPSRAALDLVLWWTWIVGCGVALWLGSRAIARPLDDRTALWALTGPLSPGRWALERVAAHAGVAVGAYAALLAGGLLLLGRVPVGIGAHAALCAAEVGLLVALAAWFGALFRPLGALALAGALWLVGHLGGVWLQAIGELGPVGSLLLAAIPDLDLLDVHGAVLAGTPPPPGQVALALAWAAAWTGAALAGTVFALERRDLG